MELAFILVVAAAASVAVGALIAALRRKKLRHVVLKEDRLTTVIKKDGDELSPDDLARLRELLEKQFGSTREDGQAPSSATDPRPSPRSAEPSAPSHSTDPVVAPRPPDDQVALPSIKRPVPPHPANRQVEAPAADNPFSSPNLERPAGPPVAYPWPFDPTSTPRVDFPAKSATANRPVQPSLPTIGSNAGSRYTDVRVLDSGREVDSGEALISKRTYDVEVAIRTRRGGITKDFPQGPIRDPGQKRETIVWVVLCPIIDDDGEVGMTVDQRFDSLVLPSTGDSSSSASFRISPRLRSGASVATFSLSFSLYSRLDLIDNIVIQMTMASNAAVVVPHPATRFLQRRPDGTSIGVFGQRNSRRVTISVDQTTPGAFLFTVVAGTDGVPSLYATRTLSVDMLNGFVSEFRTILIDAVFGPSLKAGKMTDAERDRVLGQMNQLGRRMFNVLFDMERGDGDMAALGEMLRGGLTDGDIIQISLLRGATDFVFPWQILTVNDNFLDNNAADFSNLWGARYSIEVKRCAEGGDLRPAREAARLLPSFYYGRFGFKNEPAHFAKILDAAERGLVPHLQPVIESRDELVPALLGSAKLFYFYAHGYCAAPSTPAGMKLREHVVAKAQKIDERIRLDQLAGLDVSDDSMWAMSYRQFLDTTAADPDSHLRFARGKVTLAELTSYRDPASGRLIRLSNAPVIFLNTCQSAQVWNALDESFVGFFLKRGASSVIGTESTVPISFAEPFANEVLNTIFNGAGWQGVGEAVRQARLTLMASHNNPLGLSYTVYGSADATA